MYRKRSCLAYHILHVKKTTHNERNKAILGVYGDWCIVCSADCNHDGIVNIKDVNLVGIAWNTTKSMPKYNPHADLNMDNTIYLRELREVACGQLGMCCLDKGIFSRLML